jgi:hypothetical protein
MHLWFLAVYVIVVSLTPIAVAAQRRWGLKVLVALSAAVAVVDAVSLGGHVPYVGWLNYLLCWGAFYQLGIAWRSGLLPRRGAAALAAGAGIALVLVVWLRWYPVSMIGVPGQTIDNTTPPTLALLAFGFAQSGLAMTLAPALNRVLRGGFVRRVLSAANQNVMALYLWHMIPVVIVAIVAYPAGLLPQPPEGTPAWWLARLEWVVVLSLVTALELALLWWGRRFFAAPLPTLGIPVAGRLGEALMLAGAALAATGLHFFAYGGFAPDGHFPWVSAAILGCGVLLVALRPTKVQQRSVDPTPAGG